MEEEDPGVREERAGKELEGCRIALLGLGVENEALGRYLLSKGIRFSVRDRVEGDRVRSLRREWGSSVFSWLVGETYLQDLARFDLVYRTPGISSLHPELAAARRSGTEVSSQTRLFFDLCPAAILGVTGTKGKGTTASLLALALARGPYPQVRLGGNIGLPPISFVEELTRGDLAVVELSSFQLQDLHRSPAIAVVLNIGTDHLDYHADQQEYAEAKEAICRFQTSDNYLVLNADCAATRSLGEHSPAQLLYFSIAGEVEAGAFAAQGHLWLRRHGARREQICAIQEVPLKGRHNVANALAAAAAGAAAGASAEQVAAAIRAMRGLPHRLELVGLFDGVEYYDDSLATTPKAALAALQSFESPIHLVAGGSSKGADFGELGVGVADGGVRSMSLLGDEAERIAAASKAAGFRGEVRMCESMREAVESARSSAEEGDVVLLSPACASFGLFESYSDRGDAFKRLVTGACRRD